MARWYFDNANGDTSCDSGGSVVSNDLISSDAAADTTVNTSDSNTTYARYFEWDIGSLSPGTGTYGVSVSINTISKADVRIGVEILNGSCSVVDSDTDTVNHTTTGTKTFTSKSMAPGAANRARAFLEVRRTSGQHGNWSVTIDTDHASSYLDVPGGATTIEKTTSLDSRVQKALSKTTSLDGRVQKALAKTSSFDAVLENQAFKAATIVSSVKSGTGNDTFTSSGFGSVDGAIIRISYVTSDDANGNHYSLVEAFFDGTNLYSNGCTNYDNQDTSDTSRHQYNDLRLYDPTANTTALLIGTVSTTTDGIVINWSVNSLTGARITIDLFGGLKNLAVGSLTGNATQDATTVETIGFEADVIAGMSVGLNTVVNSQNTHAWKSIGFCLNDLTQYSTGMFDVDAVGSSNCSTMTRDDALVLRTGTGTQTWLEVTTIGATSFTVTTRNSSTAIGMFYLAMEFVDGDGADVIRADCPASTGAKAWNVASGLTPVYVQFVQSLLTTINSNSTTLDMSISVGSGTSASAEAAHSIWSEDNQAFSDSLGRRSTNLIYNLHDTAVVDADLVSFAAGQVNLTYGVVQSGRIGFLLAIGPSTPSVTKTATLDARIQKQLTKTATLDSRVQRGLSQTADLDARLQAVRTATSDLDARLRQLLSHDTTFDARVQDILTLTATLDARLQRVFSKQSTLDSLLQAVRSATTTLDAAVQKTLALTADFDARLQKGLIKTSTFDAILSAAAAEKTLQATLNAVLQKVFTLGTTVNALLQKELVRTATLDARLQSELLTTTTLDSLLQVSGLTQTSTLDAVLAEIFTKSTTLDAALQDEILRTTTLEALLQRGLSLASTLDAVIVQMLSLGTSLDARVQAAIVSTTVLDARLQQALTQTTTLDARVSKEQARAAVMDSLVQVVGTLTGQLDAMVQRALTATTTFDARVQLVRTLASTMDAVLSDPNPKLFLTMDSLVQAARTLTAAMDGYVQKQDIALTSSFDAVLGLRKTIQTQIDAIVGLWRTRYLSLDAIVELGGWLTRDRTTVTWDTVVVMDWEVYLVDENGNFIVTEDGTPIVVSPGAATPWSGTGPQPSQWFEQSTFLVTEEGKLIVTEDGVPIQLEDIPLETNWEAKPAARNPWGSVDEHEN